jgi:very-short-patch-repair endonuclease
LGQAFARAEDIQVIDKPRLRALTTNANGHRGVGNLRALLGQIDIPLSETRSRLERLLLRICREFGLPIPAVNVPLFGYEVDFYWERERFVVEVDGAQHRGRQRDSDNERDVRLGLAGILVRRYCDAALRRPRAIAGEVTAILRKRVHG